MLAEAKGKEEAFPFPPAKERSKQVLEEKEGGDFFKLFFGAEAAELQEGSCHPCNDGSTHHKNQSYKDLHRLFLADDTAVFLSESYEPFFFLAHTGPLFTIDIVIA